MDNIVIPEAPIAAPVLEKPQYIPPKPPFYGAYTRISFDTQTGEMIKDKYVKSKETAFAMHLIATFLGILFFPLFGLGDFYCGRIARGFLKMFTAGGLYVWSLTDAFKARNGKYETRGKCVLL